MSFAKNHTGDGTVRSLCYAHSIGRCDEQNGIVLCYLNVRNGIKQLPITGVFRKRVIFMQVDVCGSMHHSTVYKEKCNKMQKCIKILLFHIYMKLNMFRATHRPSSGA
jgi:hypothetical protein